jgi:hypothetical protein
VAKVGIGCAVVAGEPDVDGRPSACATELGRVSDGPPGSDDGDVDDDATIKSGGEPKEVGGACRPIGAGMSAAVGRGAAGEEPCPEEVSSLTFQPSCL